MKLYDELVARGLIAQVTNEEAIREMIDNGKATFYIGFDCTADSLHVGHFMALCLMKRLQMAGNKPIALIGDGTTMIGDPSGRTDMRQMLTEETIAYNAECFKRQMEKFIDFSDGKAIMLRNSAWLKPLNYIELLREVGACFSVNNMLRAECYKQRMEKGLSFLEFNYMIMQSYDFYYMFQHYGCNMEFGGNDQWSNMLGGTELIRRKLGKDAHAMTITLLLNSEGKKMGKTAKGAVWLDPNKTTPFDFFQYWRNIDDADVMKCAVSAPEGDGGRQRDDRHAAAGEAREARRDGHGLSARHDGGLRAHAAYLRRVLSEGGGVMEAIRSYLTAVVAVSMIAVLASALSHGSRMERVVRFAAGLLALLVCVTPLLRLDARTLTDVLEQAERALDYDASGTDRTRQDMLRDLVRENTERTIEKQAEALGMLVRADVTLTEEEYPQPWSATLTGTLDPEQVRALSEFLSQSLGIPTERQTWKTYG